MNYFTSDKAAALGYAKSKAEQDGSDAVLLEVQFFTGNVWIITKDDTDIEQDKLKRLSAHAIAGHAANCEPAHGHWKSSKWWLDMKDMNCAYAARGMLSTDHVTCEQIAIRQDIPWANVCLSGTIEAINERYTKLTPPRGAAAAGISAAAGATTAPLQVNKRIKTSNKDKDVPAEILKKCQQYGEWWEHEDNQQEFNEKFLEVVVTSPITFEDIHTIARTVKYIVSGRTKTVRGNIIGATVARTKENIVPKILMHDGAFILEAIYCEDEELFRCVMEAFKELFKNVGVSNPR